MKRALEAAKVYALFMTCAALPAGLAGCGARAVAPDRLSGIDPRFAADAARLQADPVGCLRVLVERAEALRQYRLRFYRQERLGLPATLGPMEDIRARFRAEPFSVKFDWLDEHMPYYESVYNAAGDGGMLIVRERRGALPFLPPMVRAMDPEFPVKIGRAKNSITEFGLARLARRTLLPFEDPRLAGAMSIAYQGVVALDPTGRPAHYLLIQRPRTPGYAYTRQDFYIDAETMLPAGTDLYLPDGQLDARYRYAEIDPAATFTDEDFRLSVGHPAPKDAATAPAGGKTGS